MTIGGVVTLNGFIQITRAVGLGNQHWSIIGAVGGSIPFLGAVTGLVSLEATIDVVNPLNSGVAGASS